MSQLLCVIHLTTMSIAFASKQRLTTFYSGIGLETCILFAKEGANVLMADISGPALEKASAKLKQLVPSAHKVEIQVSLPLLLPKMA